MDNRAGGDRHNDSFRDLCMLYGDFNRPVFLEEILHFITSYGATKAELSAIRVAVQKRTSSLPNVRTEDDRRPGKIANGCSEPEPLPIASTCSGGDGAA